MNRFDENFNDIDPVTSRPFSWGHPDGVWIIAIIYILIALTFLVWTIFGFYKLFSEGLHNIPIILGGCVGLFLFLSTVIFLFRRSDKVFYPLIVILILSAVNFLLQNFSGGFQSSFATLVALLAQSYICYYIYGLKRDNLLMEK
jgi:hypothetical protein